ncbi:hypothetical protein, partial [Salmonella sp. s54925]|uniref:hypothetical protein n=1 Tax=Salmonella sp. s54925 TaxID=3159674 RepID=UPI00397FE8E3
DAATGLCEPISGHTNKISCLAVEGSNLYSISMDDSFRVTSTDTDECGAEEVTFDSEPKSLSVTKDGLAVVSCIDQTVVVISNGKKMSSRKFDFIPS